MFTKQVYIQFVRMREDEGHKGHKDPVFKSKIKRTKRTKKRPNETTSGRGGNVALLEIIMMVTTMLLRLPLLCLSSSFLHLHHFIEGKLERILQFLTLAQLRGMASSG